MFNILVYTLTQHQIIMLLRIVFIYKTEEVVHNRVAIVTNSDTFMEETALLWSDSEN